MKIWTIQSIDIWEKLKEGEIGTCDEKLASYLKDEECSFLETYSWIRNKMINSMSDSYYKSGIYPIWGWYIYNGLHRKPDLRYSGQGEHGEQMVCVELEIPDNNVLYVTNNLQSIINTKISPGNNIKGDWSSQMDKMGLFHN